VDAYGFQVDISQVQEEALARCNAHDQRQSLKWEDFRVAEGKLPPEDRLKKLCRKGVPPELRKQVWMEVSGANDRRREFGPSHYHASVQAGRATSPFVHQIKLDVPRTFPNCDWIQNDDGQAALRRVLTAFAHHNPLIGYCQGMNFVAAMLLIVLGHDEEAAFWVLASLIDDEDRGILYPDMYSRDLSGCHVEMRSLRGLVESKLPRLAAHLSAMKSDMSILATDWFLCLYSTSLPSETVARVWDALLHEGPKVLFRVALALLKMHEPLLLATDNPGDLLRAARQAAAEEFDREEVIRVAFDGIGSLPMDRIQKYRVRNQETVDREFAARETRARLREAVKEGGHILMEGEEELLQEPADNTCADGKGTWRDQLKAVGTALGERLPSLPLPRTSSKKNIDLER